ncbi:hypothetical protein EVAR_57371_1 [Eumeta japonica]|uniref:Uncharacterized protein n=1 Tax=Eumeta variegata TaxID=151549 RepID=A0A4C1ZEN0_EUMVA|nr:hypothetical protein EVAR_57371_1 [Eumeta japonica]
MRNYTNRTPLIICKENNKSAWPFFTRSTAAGGRRGVIGRAPAPAPARPSRPTAKRANRPRRAAAIETFVGSTNIYILVTVAIQKSTFYDPLDVFVAENEFTYSCADVVDRVVLAVLGRPSPTTHSEPARPPTPSIRFRSLSSPAPANGGVFGVVPGARRSLGEIRT